jgi:PAS domain S-box-containing protein
MSRFGSASVLRPTDDALSAREQSQVQVLRLLFLLGAGLCLLFIPLFELSSPEALDPAWARLGISGLLAGVLAASYVSAAVRRRFATWVRGTSFVIIVWFVGVAVLNGFSSDYELGVLLLHAIFTVIAGLGARSIVPVILFTGASVGTAAGGVLLSPVPFREEAVLLGGMLTISLVMAIVIQRLISARTQLQEREARLRGLANSIPGVVFQFYARPDGSRGTYFVSQHAEPVLGVAPTPEAFYDRILDGVPPSHREDVQASIEEAIERREPWRHEFPFVTPSGDRIWLLGTSAPEEKESEVVYNGVLLDITERREAEAELVRSRNRYQTLVENFPKGGVFLFDQDHRYVLAGGAELEELGLSPHALEGTTPHDLFPEPLANETVAHYDRALAGEVSVFEQQYQDKYYRVLTLPVRGNNGQVVSGMAVSLDVTAQKKQERALRDAKQEAEKASRVKTALLANMSHEVRTPLTSIIGFTELLQDCLTGQVQEFARRAHESSRHLSETLESILQLSKLEAGVETLKREQLSFVEPIRDTLRRLRPAAREASIDLQSEWPRAAVHGYWNADALRRITRNLVENAIKFTPAGGEVTVRVRADASSAVLTVEDTGIGIRSELLPHIFRAFRQESEGLGREYEGSGLGLSIVDHLVRELDGTIDVDTAKGEGTCFVVRLPRTTAADEADA